jgi:AcrR family transcriptional regulator
LSALATQKRKYELKARAEALERTRERIVTATMELHKEVGPAKTTVAEIARRAGVQRLTVYNHFPADAELFGACQTHWMRLNPLPDFSSALGLNDPAARVKTVLHGYYGWYRRTEPMAEKIQRDRGAVPSLDDLMTRTADARLAQLTEALSDGFRVRGRRAERLRALIRLALDFWTWRRLAREGFDDSGAANLMCDAIACVASAGKRT